MTDVLIVSNTGVVHRGSRLPDGTITSSESDNLDQTKRRTVIDVDERGDVMGQIRGIEHRRLCGRCFRNELISTDKYD